ncbi:MULTISPECIES: hypothetical protein [Gammaproteobacteria]|uniref:hypothetical protein n=1 Tax=Gammaproteobacteria TaxID=1236 RepID=UPI000AE23395|nr:hypothetical protein [Rheinheimera sp. EpRS3]
MTKKDNRTLAEHMELVSQKVSVWPQWQQQIFRAKVSSPQKSTNEKKLVAESA